MSGATWLVTGGAGYIGAHVIRALGQAGFGVVVLDDLSTGNRGRVPAEVPFTKASTADTAVLRSILAEHEVAGVVHLAAKKSVPDSMRDPLTYYRENVGGLGSVLQAMVDVGVKRMVFSSSAAVWGAPRAARITEQEPGNPISPYGETKLIGEWMLRALEPSFGLRWTALRYFNVAGCGAPELADRGVANLIPLVLRDLAQGRRPQVFGDDYPTGDGSCIRDYIHVVDLATAHVAAATRLMAGTCAEIYNLGRGEGVSVKEVLAVASRVTRTDVGYDVVHRRVGDVAACYADPTKAERELGWRATLDLEDMIGSAWRARTLEGFGHRA